MPIELWNFLMGATICGLAGAISFWVQKRWPTSPAVTALSWAGVLGTFGLAVYFFG